MGSPLTAARCCYPKEHFQSHYISTSREFEKFSKRVGYRDKRLTTATVGMLQNLLNKKSCSFSGPAWPPLNWLALYLRSDTDTGSNIINPISFYCFVRPEIDAYFHGRRQPDELLAELKICTILLQAGDAKIEIA
jgi:hypothetical protein